MESKEKGKIVEKIGILMRPLEADEQIAMLEVMKFGYFHDRT